MIELKSDQIQISAKWIILLLFVFAFLFPTFHNHFSSGGAIIINAGLITFCAMTLLYYWIFKRHLLVVGKGFLIFNVLFLIFLVQLPLSMFSGLFFGDINIVFSDLFEFHRPVLYFLVFALGYFLISNELRVEFLCSILIVLFVIVTLMGIAQFMGYLPSVFELYTKSLNISSRRSAVPFANPYDFAFFISFFVYLFVTKLFFHRKRYVFLLMLAMFAFVLPQSRSVAAGMLVGLGVITPSIFLIISANFKHGTIKKNFIAYLCFYCLLISIFILSIPYLLENFGYLTGQFVRFLSSGDVGNSAGIRLEQFLFAVDKASNPVLAILGNGPAKSEMEYVESIYNYQFYRYGILGIFVYFILPLLVSIGMLFKLILERQASPKARSIYIALLLWFFTLPLLMIGNNFTEQVRLSFLFYFCLGMIARQYDAGYNNVQLRVDEKLSS